MGNHNEVRIPDTQALESALATGRTIAVERELLPPGASLDELDRLLPGLPDDPEGSFAFASPDSRSLHVGRGRADVVDVPEGGGLRDALRAVLTREGLLLDDSRLLPHSLRYHGGISFHGRVSDPAWRGFGAGSFVLPRVEVIRRADGRVLRRDHFPAGTDREAARAQLREPLLREQVEPPAPPADLAGLLVARDERAGFERDVGRLLAAVKAAEVEKVVIARRAHMKLPAPLSASRLFALMRARFPDCFHFIFKVAGGAVFAGATPERLARLQGREIRTMALAGSAAREDRSLLASPKDRSEHRIVVDSIRNRLERAGVTLDPLQEPEVLELANIRHLRTPVRGEAGRPALLREAAASLHPTPAVGGRPSERALEWIRALEGDMRGWFAAPCGWIESAGDAELVVALRSALIWRDEALLFAGAGIVAGSDPAREFDETVLKMEAMRGLLQEAGCNE